MSLSKMVGELSDVLLTQVVSAKHLLHSSMQEMLACCFQNSW